MLTVTKTFDIAYGHRLPNHEGLCRNFHGHTGILEITISGEGSFDYGSPSQGMIIDFKDLKKIVKTNIEDYLDHTFLLWREDISAIKFMEEQKARILLFSQPPTAEVICEWIATMLREKFPQGIKLQRVKFYETPTSYAEWTKD